MATTQSFVAMLLASFTTHPTIAKSPNNVANSITNAHRPSVTHRYPSVDSCYSNGNRLAILKRHEEQREEVEYVTSFYKRVRDKRRALFDRQLQQHEEQLHPQGDNKDHSLDHYFDHQLLLSTSYTKGSSSPASSSSSSAVRRVRGGAASTISLAPADQGESRSSKSEISPSEHNHKRHHQGHLTGCSRSHHSEVDSHWHSKHNDCDDYDLHHSKIGKQNLDRHLGLLRVPCNIAINPEDASLSYHGPSQTKTQMAAYVDTGAQVTIISASAAKRAGIYHLMDRRYAGHATGVGHCKVLGRIPARHVYFLLGEDNCGSKDDHETCRGGYYGRDYRGGGEEYCFDNEEEESDPNIARMDGPALTVLEGTGVAQGVDILLGLDALQDWEANISLPTKSITVKKRQNRNNRIITSSRYGGNDYARRKGGASMVIPFADASPQKTRHEKAATRCQSHASSFIKQFRRQDIESDLDLLDQSGHEFPDEGRHHRHIVHTSTMQKGSLASHPRGETTRERMEDEEDEYDYFQEAEDDEDVMLDGQEDLDLSDM